MKCEVCGIRDGKAYQAGWFREYQVSPTARRREQGYTYATLCSICIAAHHAKEMKKQRRIILISAGFGLLFLLWWRLGIGPSLGFAWQVLAGICCILASLMGGAFYLADLKKTEEACAKTLAISIMHSKK